MRERRLLIGPNYMLPDEFLIGGEAHIRNLMTGIRQARQFGEPMMVGYAPDAFGHIAHLPAILRGFGIDSVLIWRGVGAEATTSEFRWAAPDGSEVLALHFAYGYGMLPALPEDRELLAGALKNVRGLLEPLATTRYVLIPNGTDHLPGAHGPVRRHPHRERDHSTTRRWCTGTTRTSWPRSSRSWARRGTRSCRGWRASSGRASARTCWRGCCRRGCG